MAIMPALFVRRQGSADLVPVASIDEARDRWNEYRDRVGIETGENGASQIGNGITVVDADGTAIARVSYNGRIWLPGDTQFDEAEAAGGAPLPRGKARCSICGAIGSKAHLKTHEKKCKNGDCGHTVAETRIRALAKRDHDEDAPLPPSEMAAAEFLAAGAGLSSAEREAVTALGAPRAGRVYVEARSALIGAPRNPNEQGSLFDPPRATLARGDRPPRDRIEMMPHDDNPNLWMVVQYVDGLPTPLQTHLTRQQARAILASPRSADEINAELDTLPENPRTAAERKRSDRLHAELRGRTPEFPPLHEPGHRYVLSYGAHPHFLTVHGVYKTKAEAEDGKRGSPRALQTHITLTKDMGLGPGAVGAIRQIPGSQAMEFREYPGPAKIGADGLSVVRTEEPRSPAAAISPPPRTYNPDVHRKGDPTHINMVVLSEYFGPNDRIPNQVEATAAPHMRRCLKAGLVVPEGRTALVLTKAGQDALAAWRASNPDRDWREAWKRHQERMGSV